MNIANKIANMNHEYHESTRTWSRHGLGASKRRGQKIQDRKGKRREARQAFKDECNSDGA